MIKRLYDDIIDNMMFRIPSSALGNIFLKFFHHCTIQLIFIPNFIPDLLTNLSSCKMFLQQLIV